MNFDFMCSLHAEILNASPRGRTKIGQQFDFLFDKLIETAGATRAVEVGAYEASFSKRFKRRHPGSSSIAYEANPYVYELFKARVQATGVDYRHCCVGAENATIEIAIPRDFRGVERRPENQMASLMPNLRTDATERVPVDCVRLDDDIDLKEQDRIALWIDVEGATSQVLAAAENTLESTVGIAIEVESVPIWQDQWLAPDVDRYLSSRGFVALTRDVQRINQFNVLYANPHLVDLQKFSRLVSRYLVGSHVFSR